VAAKPAAAERRAVKRSWIMDLETTAKLEAIRSAMARSTQITTLSTAVVVLSGSILKDKFIATEYTTILWASWIMMGLSLILGLLYLGSMSHRLGRVKTKEDLRMKVIGLERILLLSQEVSFVVGMMMFGYFLAINV
jgi:hypothetical protein